MNNLLLKHRFALKWIGISFLIKGLMFVLFAVLFYQNWNPERIINYLFIESGDTSGYYPPVESFVNSGVYSSFCRMPGLLPIYGPLYFLFGEHMGKTLVILLQFITSTISVYLLAQIASNIFKTKKIFYVTFFLYAFSSFVSNWDHFGLSDSFSVSFLIFAIYFLVEFKISRNVKYLWLAGIFLAWSVFFRPVHGIILPVLALIYLMNLKKIQQSVYYTLVFSLPLVLSILLWAGTNFRKHHKLIILQGPVSECFGALTPELLSIRELIIAWGGDYQPWSKGSEAEWFFSKQIISPEKKVIRDSYLTSVYNYDSLLILRSQFMKITSDSISDNSRKTLREQIIQTSGNYLAAYKNEHGFRYYFLNKLKTLKQLMLPGRLDDFPTPAFKNMTIFHKLLKGSYYLFFLFISVTGFIGCVQQVVLKNYFALIPLTMILLIGSVLGYVEQRYLCPAYPFLVICSAALLLSIESKLRLRKLNT